MLHPDKTSVVIEKIIRYNIFLITNTPSLFEINICKMEDLNIILKISNLNLLYNLIFLIYQNLLKNFLFKELLFFTSRYIIID